MASLWRASIFGLYGYREFTRSGYERHAQSFIPTDLDTSLSGQTAIVTGANSGIGYEVAKALYQRGATVYMICRDRGRADSAREKMIKEVEEVKKDSTKGELKVEIVDVSKPKEISAFATRVFGKDGFLDPVLEGFTPLERLDILVNNAGVLNNEWNETPDGLESSYATNVLGTLHMTYALLPTLLHTANTQPEQGPPRVITVSSGGAYNAKLSVSGMEPKKEGHDGVMAYAYHKRLQIEITRLWASQYPSVHFSVMHPGWASTPGVDRSLPGFAQRMGDKLRTPAQGADTVVWLALKKRGESGEYWLDRSVTRRHLFGAGTDVGDEVVKAVEAASKLTLNKILKGENA